ncbi:MAG: acetyl-CoA carboxylase carboxyl transferase subunit alpha [Lactobacillaceae bacterium]|jgi:acetyl-CoA carboxylase carboxyl transferase subunit alpha|nr:acetyl-CoA carboxylase carboxyl transferase subunit alpha [Lactobacillaceae bacterium]
MALFKREMSAAQVVKKSREDRFHGREIIEGVFDNFFEQHGDRLYGEDSSVIGGVAELNGQAVTVIAIDKGTNLDDKLNKRNGSPQPWGYRKAIRLMEQANKFGRPIITLINTPGAFPGKTAEDLGQGDAIAQSILKSMTFKVPMIAVIYGEGGSGGALALATTDRVWMFQHATYSILSPEGFAAILWKDSKRAGEAAELMGLTPKNLLDKQVIDAIIPESNSHKRVFAVLRTRLHAELKTLGKVPTNKLVQARRARFRVF